MKRPLLLMFLLLIINNVSFAQFPKTFPEDGLDVNVSISYSFYKNESQQERQAFMNKFTAFAIEKGFNVVDVAEVSMSMTEVEKLQYNKRNDSLQVKYTLSPIQHPMSNFIVITHNSDQKSKRYTDKIAFQLVLESLIKDVDKFTASHPEANKVAYESYLNRPASPFDPLDVEDKEENDDEPVFISAGAKYIDELPSDLPNQTLLFMIYNDFDVSPEDSALISAEELVRRKKKILKYRKMNARFKENFKEYPYPVLYCYEKDLKELEKKHLYRIVDHYKRESSRVIDDHQMSQNRINGINNGVHTRLKIVVYHNYCIKDLRKADTYYRLPSWKDCDKELENGCLKYVAKTLVKKESK